MNATSMAKSLGFYVHVKRLAGVVQADFERVDDYHDFLADVVPSAQMNAAIAGFGNENPLLPLDEITLTQIQYGDIVGQIFANVSFITLSLPHPPPQVPIVQNTVSYFDNYIQSLDGGKGDPRTKADVESIVDRMNSILAEREANEQRVNGLVVGRVQSGKTRNYVGLMLKAVDEGWNVIIVLTSANTALADQTKGRINKDFEKANAHMQTPLTFRDEEAATSPTHLLSPNSTSFYWGVAMKERHNLDSILDWLHKNENIAPKMRILVIDDEADNATPDSNTRTKTQLTESEIDELVSAIRNEGESDFSYLADWILDVQDIVSEAQEKAECDPGSKEDNSIHSLQTKLEQGGGDTEKMSEILTTDEFLDLLNMQQYTDEGGVLVDLKQDAIKYFNGTGSGPRSAKTFVRFLNTVLQVARERSAISLRICELIDCKPKSDEYTFNFQRCAYIAYTATPYANILNERPDQTPLYADFIKPLATSPLYFGLDKIFGRDYKAEPPIPPKMNIVDAIGTDDKRFVLNPIQGIKDGEKKEVLPVSIGDDLRYTCDNPSKEGAWETMARAVAWAFCSAGARRHNRFKKGSSDMDDRWTTMMVNISPKTDAHDSLRNAIAKYLKLRCKSDEDRVAFLGECHRTWEYFTGSGKAAYTSDDFEQTFNNAQDVKYGTFTDYPTWEEICDDVRYFIEGWDDIRVHTIIINSVRADNIENQKRYNQTGTYENSLSDDHLWIVVGGNTIGRGLTLRGLTASYFDRVRKTVAVDTMTQMGRWFGYRQGYELLPRIWMTADTVREMKKVAFIEGAMHESMHDLFSQGVSPQDPEHYPQIYSWGRKLSGRARAQSTLMQSIGLLTTTNVMPGKAVDVQAVYKRTLRLVHDLGEQTLYNKPEYIYGDTPLWLDVSKDVIRTYLNDVMEHYPEATRQRLRALIREINQSDACSWNVIIGEPAKNRGQSFDMGVGRRIFCGSPQPPKVIGDALEFAGSARTDMAFFAMIRTEDINRTDAILLDRKIAEVVSTIKRKAKENGGTIPMVIQNALAPYQGDTLEERIRNLVAAVRDDGRVSVPNSIRECMGHYIANRSAIEYRNEAYSTARIVNPAMQIYLLPPPVELGCDHIPLIAPSFYWPDHSPDDFNLVSIGMSPASHNPSEQLFGETVVGIIAQNGFPMSVSQLKPAVLAELPECTEDFFNAHINHPIHGIKYAKVPSKKAYYHTDWAADPVAKIRQFALERAAEILSDHQPRKREDLAQTVLANNPALEGLFNPNSPQERNAVFADENLPQFGIVKNEDGTLQIQ